MTLLAQAGKALSLPTSIPQRWRCLFAGLMGTGQAYRSLCQRKPTSCPSGRFGDGVNRFRSLAVRRPFLRMARRSHAAGPERSQTGSSTLAALHSPRWRTHRAYQEAADRLGPPWTKRLAGQGLYFEGPQANFDLADFLIAQRLLGPAHLSRLARRR
jgi:hypothetical protein